MATIVLAAAGGALGSSVGGGLMGLSSLAIGKAVGATAGRLVDRQIGKVLGMGGEAVSHGSLDRIRLTGTGEGRAVPQVFGRMRVGGHVLWASGFFELPEGPGGGKGRPSGGMGPTHGVTLAIGLCEGEVAGIGRVWADGQEIRRHEIDLRVYRGTADQLPDPAIEAIEGAGNVPGYRGLAYVVIEALPLAQFGNRVPQFSFEVVRNEWRPGAGDLTEHVRGVAMIPGTGEFSLAEEPVQVGPDGEGSFANVHSRVARSDLAASLEALTTELPRSRALSLVVSWFGDDLRAGRCKVEPKIEAAGREEASMVWRAGGIGAEEARPVPAQDGRAVYGGTPADASVVEAIRAARDAGQDVMFYPFILMDQMTGSGLADPWGAAEQPPLPWRGRITCAVAPGLPGSPDGTAAVDAEVAAFMGSAAPGDFSVEGTEVSYAGPEEWSFRRMILHYAYLCASAGGVESFCIGSEMRGLTQLRGASGFPAVEALRTLAAEVRGILGPDVKIGYAADWSEYFGYHPQEGSGDVYFHLDPLWADRAIDFVGIDNYMPLSDWRGTEGEADAAFGGPYVLDYLKANIEGGEGFDWFYASDEDRAAQVRTPITDGYGEPWVWRYKDIRAWWSHTHHERSGGVRSSVPTAWVPGSKPVRFTELGCAAIDKATNQPNKFLDAKSSESSLPRFSDGRRDDFVQVQYLRAMDEYWADAAQNPVSAVYGGPMVDMDHAYVWAWDARPFPQFPGLPDVWSDADNYFRGHWITGRSGYRTLPSVVAELCAQAGVDADVSELTGVVRGFAVSDVSDVRAALQPLMLAHGFDAVERAGVLSFRMRGAADVAVLDEAELVAGDEGDLVALREPLAEQPGRIAVGFVAETGDFPAATAEAAVPWGTGQALSLADLPLVLTRGEARNVADRWLAETEAGRDRIRFALPPSKSGIGAGDVVSLRGGRYRIDRVEQGADLGIEAVRIGTARIGAEAEPDGMVVLPEAVPVPPVVAALDLPLLPGETEPVTRIAAASRPWPGRVAVLSGVNDAGYRLAGVLERSAVMGVTEGDLVNAGAGRVDRGPALRVRVMNGALASVGELALQAGANLMAIGDGQVWELFQFRDAELVGERTWELSHRLRGQAGTDAAMPQVWPAGSRVVLIDDALGKVVGADREGLRDYRIGAADATPGGPSFAHLLHESDATALRPLSPVHLRIAVDGGALDISWIRRTRLGGDGWDGMDVPLGEEREVYLVRVLRGTEVLREIVTERPEWRHEAADRMADGAGCRVEIAQLSQLAGAGAVLSGDLPDP